MKNRKVIILSLVFIFVLAATSAVFALSNIFGGSDSESADLTRGLVGYWKFDEMSGTTAKDKSGSGNDGTLTNNPKWTQGPTTQGLSGGGGALEFDGIDDFVDVGDVLIDGYSSFTVSAWVNPDAIESGAFCREMIVGKSGSADDSFRMCLSQSNEVYFYLENVTNTENNLVTSSDPISLNTWNYVVVSYDGIHKRIYVNGVEEASVLFSGSVLDSSNSLTIGATSIDTQFFNGTIDDVRIYNRVLSADEIRRLYNGRGPVAHWRFDEGSGSTAFDAAGSNDGTLFGEMATSTANGWKAGKYGTALSFDGVDDYVNIGDDNALDISDSMTISAWISPDTILGADQIVAKEIDNSGTGTDDSYAL